MITIAILILTTLVVNCQEVEVIPIDTPNNITIAYGSCVNTFDEDADIRQVFQTIAQTQPDLWMWGGDAVYLDGQTFFTGSLPGPGYDISNETYVRNVFDTLKNHEAYASFISNTRVVGTWDDHDYAYNNADETFEYKERNMDIYLDFLDEPENSPRRQHSGVYTSYYVGEDRLIKIILLDVRYNRDPEPTTASFLDTDTTEKFEDMLGDEQWQWLDGQLDDEAPTYTLIMSGTQYLPNNRPIIANWYKDSRERFLNLIVEKQKSGVVLLSGDVHFAEMITHPCPSRVGYPRFYEFTSSGMTHSSSAADVLDGVFDTFSTEQDRYFGKNFALLRFTGDQNSTNPPNLVFEARAANGSVVLSKEVPYSDLVFNSTLANNYNGCEEIDGNIAQDAVSAVDNAVDTAQNIFESDNQTLDQGINVSSKLGLGCVLAVILLNIFVI